MVLSDLLQSCSNKSCTITKQGGYITIVADLLEQLCDKSDNIKKPSSLLTACSKVGENL